MNFRIQKRQWENADGTVTVTWRLMIREYDRHGNKTDIYPEKRTWPKYGFNPDDTIEQAKEKLLIARNTEKLKRDAFKRAKIESRLKREDMLESTYLPADLWKRFVQFYIGRRGWDELPPKVDSHLRAFRKMVKTINVEPAAWPEQSGKIYAYFTKKGLSFSYFKKLHPIINAYGYFYCKHFNQPFLEVPAPPSGFVERINDANFESRDGKTNESQPLTPALLEKLQHWEAPQYLWMRLSLYFGLRPKEVDSLTPNNKGKRWDVSPDKKGTPILSIYQPKLVHLPRDRRWKYIPCILPEQRELTLELLGASPVKRPHVKYLKKNLGPGFNLYAGRKGFDPLMRAIGQKAENIMRWEGRRDFRDLEAELNQKSASSYERPSNKDVSQWLGHSSMLRTDTNYREIGAVDYDDVAAQ